jgi:uncharacterized MAPEG superfamily protein
MTIPQWALLGFAVWTLLMLFGTVGVYRWSKILTGQVQISEWQADVPQGSDWYQRAMRAHMNCVENLPVFAAIVFCATATGADSRLLDWLAGPFWLRASVRRLSTLLLLLPMLPPLSVSHSSSCRRSVCFRWLQPSRHQHSDRSDSGSHRALRMYLVSLMGLRLFVDVPACESSPNADPQADCHQWHYYARNSIAGEETSSAPILTHRISILCR